MRFWFACNLFPQLIGESSLHGTNYRYVRPTQRVPAWWNGRHKRLKISGLNRPCRFESGRGYHVLGDFSFKTVSYGVASNFVYLFMYPFVDGNLAFCYARARPRIIGLMCISPSRVRARLDQFKEIQARLFGTAIQMDVQKHSFFDAICHNACKRSVMYSVRKSDF